jgi:PAS domain S-box-containing protein
VGALVFNYRDITDRKQAEEELRKNTARTQALADISRTLATVRLDYQAVLDATAQRTTELIGDACSIRLVSDDGQWLVLASLYHPMPKTLAFLREILGTDPLRTDTGSVAQIIQTGQPMLIPVISPEQLKAIVPATSWSILEHIKIHSLLTVPLRAQGGVLGTLTLVRDQPDRPYTSEDQAFLQDLADRAALSIANARLYTATQRLNTELEQRVSERTAALSEANNLLQMMLDHMPDQIYFKDAQSRFIRNSRSQARALGLNDPAEIVGKSDFDFFPHAQLSYEKEQEIIRSGKPLVNEEERVVWPDGQETWVSTTKVPLPDQTGQIIGTFGISRDITDRKQAEVALQKAKLELEAANKELEAFSYSVSHDLRSPLRTIDGFSQALLEDYADHLPAEGQNYLKRVRAATQRMGQLIDDLLNLSKVTRAPMKLVSVDLSGLVQGIVTELQRTQPERRVNFKITSNLKARGDPSLLQAVLENLLNNAWKFTAKREKAEIEFGSKSENNEVVYFIRDNGAGFDMTYVDKLFGAFQRLHAMTEFSGTGIGLATVQRIINRHGGRIWAEAEVDRGATFFFTLPIADRLRPKAALPEQDPISRRAEQII